MVRLCSPPTVFGNLGDYTIFKVQCTRLNVQVIDKDVFPGHHGFMGEGVFPISDVEGYAISGNCPIDVSENIKGAGWGVSVSSETRDRMSKRTLRGGYRPVMIHYKIKDFVVSRNRKELDLTKLLPDGWSWDAVRPASPEILAPEVEGVFAQHQEMDFSDQRLEVGKMSSVGNREVGIPDLDWSVKNLLWNILFVKAVADTGLPVNDDAIRAVREAVLERRGELLKSFDERGADPNVVAQRPIEVR